jgi:virginiamycin A acetyltransferase
MTDILPNPNVINPIPNIDSVIYVRPTIKNKNIIVGDFTYFSDRDFERQVKHFYDFYDDKLIIGKFCQIAKGVEFIMNGANHQKDCPSTFPFYIFEGWGESAPPLEKMPLKGDTVIGNDVWIGENATILPGTHIGDGTIIGLRSVVGGTIPPYSIAVGNPARIVKKRFDDDLIALLLEFRWWDRSPQELRELIPILHNNNLGEVKEALLRWHWEP